MPLPSDSSSGGAFVNAAAFEDDEEVGNNNSISYARWINECNDDSRIELEVKQKNQQIVKELSDAFKNVSSVEKRDMEDNDDDEAQLTKVDIMERPSSSVSRADILEAISSKYSQGALGELVTNLKFAYSNISHASQDLYVRTPTVHIISGFIKVLTSPNSGFSRSGKEK